MPEISESDAAVVAEAPGNIRLKALKSLVRSRMSKGQFLQALPIIEKAREIAPADVRLRLSLDSVWRRLSMDVATRVALMEDTLDLQATSPVVKFQLARALIDSGGEAQLSRARTLLEDIISERPDMSRAHLLYASLLNDSEPERSRVHRETAARLEHKHHRANALNHLMRQRYWTLSTLAIALMATLAVVLLPQLLKAPGFEESIEPADLAIQPRVEDVRRKQTLSSKLTAMEKDMAAALASKDTSTKTAETKIAELSSKLLTAEKDLAAALASKDTSAKTAETTVAELSSKLTAMEKDLAAALASKDTSAKAAETQVAELSSKLAAMDKKLTALRAARVSALLLKANTLRLDWKLRTP